MRKYVNSPAVFSMETWGDKTTITLPASDIGADELLDTFKRLALASGWSEALWKEAVVSLAAEYEDDRRYEDTKELSNEKPFGL